jgi:hypothetical protein
VKHALKILHPNAWENLRSELVEDPSRFKYYGGFLKIFVPKKYKNMKNEEIILYKSVFPDYVRDMVIASFENKEKYNYSTDRRQYYFSVETNMGTDGVFRAWYSRGIRGGGNTWSYLLLNPTTAWFVEKD